MIMTRTLRVKSGERRDIIFSKGVVRDLNEQGVDVMKGFSHDAKEIFPGIDSVEMVRLRSCFYETLARVVKNDSKFYINNGNVPDLHDYNVIAGAIVETFVKFGGLQAKLSEIYSL